MIKLKILEVIRKVKVKNLIDAIYIVLLQQK